MIINIFNIKNILKNNRKINRNYFFILYKFKKKDMIKFLDIELIYFFYYSLRI